MLSKYTESLKQTNKQTIEKHIQTYHSLEVCQSVEIFNGFCVVQLYSCFVDPKHDSIQVQKEWFCEVDNLR